MAKVLVAMSGGVDSSVAAWLLKQQGHEVQGVFMRNWTDETIPGFVTRCLTKEDEADARQVAAQLGITFHTVNFEEEYRQLVLEDFFSQYAAGRTPNPDVLCNRHIKFGSLLRLLPRFGCAYLATGHYAAKETGENGQSLLLTAKDQTKDQTYFLHGLNQEQLKHALFPLGDLLKSEVRLLAKQAGLKTAAKKDSQGICFVGPVAVAKFLQTKINKTPGMVLTTNGQVVGQHQGLSFYTIGQRSGLGIAGPCSYYVAAKRPQDNTLVVAVGKDDPALYRQTVYLKKINWLTGQEPNLPLSTMGKIRYRQPNQPLTVEKGSNDYLVKFDQPQFAVALGQSLVFYQDQVVLGGGVMEAYDE